MIVRHAVNEDLAAIMKMYDIARDYMKKSGNPNQWDSTYPSEEIILEDIARGNSYVIVGKAEAEPVFKAEDVLETSGETEGASEENRWDGCGQADAARFHELSASELYGVFTFILGDEPTYRIIDNGAWHSYKPYGTIHRLASSGTKPGIAKTCFDYCANVIDYLRVDTHADNKTMQTVITKYGFVECGTIYVENGPRVAYDYLRA